MDRWETDFLRGFERAAQLTRQLREHPPSHTSVEDYMEDVAQLHGDSDDLVSRSMRLPSFGASQSATVASCCRNRTALSDGLKPSSGSRGASANALRNFARSGATGALLARNFSRSPVASSIDHRSCSADSRFSRPTRNVSGGGAFAPPGSTLLRWYVLHFLMLPFTIVIFMAIHFWRVRKDGGISGPL